MKITFEAKRKNGEKDYWVKMNNKGVNIYKGEFYRELLRDIVENVNYLAVHGCIDEDVTISYLNINVLIENKKMNSVNYDTIRDSTWQEEFITRVKTIRELFRSEYNKEEVYTREIEIL